MFASVFLHIQGASIRIFLSSKDFGSTLCNIYCSIGDFSWGAIDQISPFALKKVNNCNPHKPDFFDKPGLFS